MDIQIFFDEDNECINDYHKERDVIFNKELKGSESISCISYLSNKAPNNLVKKGAKFKLYEGFKMVAQGEIID